MFKHTLYTWLLANLLNPIFLMMLIGIREGWQEVLNDSTFPGFIFLELISWVFSIPCLLLGWLSIWIINQSEVSSTAKFLLWLIAAPCLAALEIFFILMLDDSFDRDFLIYSIPALAAVFLAVIIRFDQFKKITSSPQIDNHGSEMV